MAIWRRQLSGLERSDWLLAGLITAVAEIEVLLTRTADHGSVGMRAVTSLSLLALGWRRHLPLIPVIFVCGTAILDQLIAGWAQAVVPLLAVFLLAYSLGAYSGNLATAAGATIIGSTPLALQALGSRTGFSAIESLTWVLGVETILPILVGRIVSSRARLIDRLQRQNRALVEQRASSAAAATAEERLRLALQLREVVANSVDAIVAEVAVAQADPGNRGLQAVERVESIARGALGSMRVLLLELTPVETR